MMNHSQKRYPDIDRSIQYRSDGTGGSSIRERVRFNYSQETQESLRQTSGRGIAEESCCEV